MRAIILILILAVVGLIVLVIIHEKLARRLSRARRRVAFYEAAFGFTTQNLPMYVRKSLRISSPHALPVSATCCSMPTSSMAGCCGA